MNLKVGQMDHSYWRKQTTTKPLFPDIEWNKPEQKSQAGRLGIIGGNKLGFAGVAEAYATAQATGVGEVRVLLPDALKKSLPPVITDTIYGATNPSGGLAGDAVQELHAIGAWATSLLFIGDAGRNSETAVLYETFINEYAGPITLTRDAVDLVKNNNLLLVDRPNTSLVISFAQLQKLFQSVYYPKVLTFSMQLTQLVEALHKFTITYPITITVLHNETIIVAHEGNIVTQPWDAPMKIWRGTTATQAASYWMWNPNTPLEAIASSLL